VAIREEAKKLYQKLRKEAIFHRKKHGEVLAQYTAVKILANIFTLGFINLSPRVRNLTHRPSRDHYFKVVEKERTRYLEKLKSDYLQTLHQIDLKEKAP
jgi:hypothetical protein